MEPMFHKRDMGHPRGCNISAMSESTTPKPAVRKTGLSPKQQKLQAMLEKMKGKDAKGGEFGGSSAGGFKAKGTVAKKTAFQRKAT